MQLAMQHRSIPGPVGIGSSLAGVDAPEAVSSLIGECEAEVAVPPVVAGERQLIRLVPIPTTGHKYPSLAWQV